MTDPAGPFSSTYAQARAQFRQAAVAAGLELEAIVHPLRGIEGEELAMDIAWQGPRDATGLLLITSACHGIEGYCGSGVQVSLLRDDTWHQAVRARGHAVLYIHALNPHGFSHGRRVTEDGVDLNRNWHDFSGPLPENPGYDSLAEAIVPSDWPEPEHTRLQLAAYAAQHGERGLQAALSGGQYKHPQGLFYGGQAPTWSHRTLRRGLQQHAQRCRHLAWIDVHTGLGPNGHGERIFACRDEAAALARARAWWGEGVTSIYDGSSSSALLQGLMWQVVPWDCPQAVHTGIALEVGTQSVAQVMNALRADHWLQAHPARGAPQAHGIRQLMREAFYTETDTWKQQVIHQAHEAAHQALIGLTSEGH